MIDTTLRDTSKHPDIEAVLVSIHVIVTIVVSWLDWCDECILKDIL